MVKSRAHRKERHLSRKLSIKDTKKGAELSETGYASRFLRELNEYRLKHMLCDVTLVVDGGHIPVHRVVLALSSEYFQAMFTVNMQEKTSGEVCLIGHSARAVQLIIDYMYTGHMSVEDDIVQDVLVLSDMLQMSLVKQLCVGYLTRNLEISNCLDMWQLATRYSCEELADKCLLMIKQRFPDIVKTDSFLDLSPELISWTLKLNDLYLGPTGEVIVARGLLSWFRRDSVVRLADFKEAMSFIRWDTMSQTDLDELLKDELLTDELCDTIRGLKNNDLVARQPIRSLLISGGYMQARTGPLCPRHNAVEMLNLGTLEWKQCQSLPVAPSYVFSFVLCGRLICIIMKFCNGENTYRDSTYQDVSEYDPINDEWQPLAIPRTVKSTISQTVRKCVLKKGVLTFDDSSGTLYVLCSEFTQKIVFKEVCDDTQPDDFDMSTSTLKMLPSAEHDRVDMAAVVCRGRLYSLGGSLGVSTFDARQTRDVYVWDEDMELWLRRASMHEARACMSAVQHDGLIYVMGGFYDAVRLRSLENYNTDSDQWTLLSEMQKPRSHFSCVAAAGKIFVLGGKSRLIKTGGARKVLNLGEVYDIESNQWTNLPQNMEHRRCLAAVSVF